MARVNNIFTLAVFLIILCAVLAVCLLYKSNVKIIKYSRHYPNKTLIFDDYSFKDEKLVYLVCDKYTPSKCKIIEENFMYKSVDTRSCNVNLDVEGELNEDSIFVVAYGQSNSILLWDDDKSKIGDRTYPRISVVDLDLCKQSGYKEYDNFTTTQLKKTKKIVPYNFSFDLFYKNYTECLYKECVLALDREGKLQDRSKAQIYNYGNDISNIYPIQNDALEKGLVYLRSFDKKSDLWILHNDGRQNCLNSFNGEIKMSIVDESIGICSRADINSNITCSQYNATGGLTLNVTLNDVNNITHLQTMYTLPEGGFLLSFVDFGRCQEDICNPALLSNYFILKIDAAGNQVGKLRFHGLEKDCKGIKLSYIHKQPKKGEYCVFIVPFNKQSDKFEVLVNCFPMSNFVA